jgi:alpha-1,2-mannosyltransferase
MPVVWCLADPTLGDARPRGLLEHTLLAEGTVLTGDKGFGGLHFHRERPGRTSPEGAGALGRTGRIETGSMLPGSAPVERVRRFLVRTGMAASRYECGAAERRRLPAWLLPPGLAVLAAVVYVEAQLLRHRPAGALDLRVYQSAGVAFTNGRSVYDFVYGPDRLPFTYPPTSLLFFVPLSRLTTYRAWLIVTVVSVAALALTAWLVLGMLGHPANAGRLGAAAALTALGLLLQPVYETLILGQINILLMLLVVADLAQPDRRWYKGLGVGLATAVKLVPALFVVYLLLTRRWRAAGVAVAAFLAAVALTWVVDPRDSAGYWLQGLFLRSERVSSGFGPGYLSNQSLRGVAYRVFGAGGGTIGWLILAAAVAALGLTVAVRAFRRLGEVAGMLCCALTALLISPISWTHHWVWVLPVLAALIAAIGRVPPPRRTAVATAATGLGLAFLAWPFPSGGSPRLLEPVGIIWRIRSYTRPTGQPPGLLQQIAVETYAIVGLGLLVLAAVWLSRAGSRPAGLSAQEGRCAPAAEAESAVPPDR